MEAGVARYFQKAIDAIQQHYPAVQDALLCLEAKEHRRLLSCYVDIRDVMSHLVSTGGSPTEEAAQENYANLCEHMRRASSRTRLPWRCI